MRIQKRPSLSAEERRESEYEEEITMARVPMRRRCYATQMLGAPKSQRFLRFAIAMPIADPRNRAISETRERGE